jgi:hypothetical protein
MIAAWKEDALPNVNKAMEQKMNQNRWESWKIP